MTQPGDVSIADEIRKLAELRDSGILTEEEFQGQKQQLLAEMSLPPSSSPEPVHPGAQVGSKPPTGGRGIRITCQCGAVNAMPFKRPNFVCGGCNGRLFLCSACGTYCVVSGTKGDTGQVRWQCGPCNAWNHSTYSFR